MLCGLFLLPGCSWTRPREAQKFLEKYQRLDLAVDKFFENPREFSSGGSTKRREQEQVTRLNELFDRYRGVCCCHVLGARTTSVLTHAFFTPRSIYKDPGSDEDVITFDGTIRWCEEMNQNPEDVVFLAVAYELKSPSMATWTRQGWLDGWKSLG